MQNPEMVYLLDQLDEEITALGGVWEENPTLSALKAARNFVYETWEACNG